MQLVAPDILAEGHGLSAPVCFAGLALGLLLWLLGTWGRRFWLVLAVTVVAGVYGLALGPEYDVQPLVSGLLLAITAGALALALVRLVSFLAGGAAVLLLARSLAPAWNEPFVLFFVGGFAGLLLLPLWLMALTSFAGTLVITYCGMWLIESSGEWDAAVWSAERPVLLNWAVAAVATLGFLIQLLLERRRRHKQKAEEPVDDPSRTTWLWWGGERDTRRRRRAA